MKMLMYCHRHWNENTHDWNRRRDLCRKVVRALGFTSVVEAEDFPTLQRLCLREGYQHVMLPSAMHTPVDVLRWLSIHRVRIIDAMHVQTKLGISR